LPFKEAMRQAQLGGALEVPVEALPEVAAFKVLAVFKGAIEDGQQAGVGLGQGECEVLQEGSFAGARATQDDVPLVVRVIARLGLV